MAVETMLIGINDDDEDDKKPMLYKVRILTEWKRTENEEVKRLWNWLFFVLVVLQVDPAGYYAGYHASCAGTKEIECTNWLEKKMKSHLENSSMNLTQAIRMGISALQSVLSEDFKASQIEVGIVSCDDTSFKKLTEQEIDDHLVAISERD